MMIALSLNDRDGLAEGREGVRDGGSHAQTGHNSRQTSQTTQRTEGGEERKRGTLHRTTRAGGVTIYAALAHTHTGSIQLDDDDEGRT